MICVGAGRWSSARWNRRSIQPMAVCCWLRALMPTKPTATTRGHAASQSHIRTSHGLGFSKLRRQSRFEMCFAPKHLISFMIDFSGRYKKINADGSWFEYFGKRYIYGRQMQIVRSYDRWQISRQSGNWSRTACYYRHPAVTQNSATPPLTGWCSPTLMITML